MHQQVQKPKPVNANLGADGVLARCAMALSDWENFEAIDKRFPQAQLQKEMHKPFHALMSAGKWWADHVKKDVAELALLAHKVTGDRCKARHSALSAVAGGHPTEKFKT